MQKRNGSKRKGQGTRGSIVTICNVRAKDSAPLFHTAFRSDSSQGIRARALVPGNHFRGPAQSILRTRAWPPIQAQRGSWTRADCASRRRRSPSRHVVRRTGSRACASSWRRRPTSVIRCTRSGTSAPCTGRIRAHWYAFMPVYRAIVERLRDGSAIWVIVRSSGSSVWVVAIWLIRVELREWRDGIGIGILGVVECRRVPRGRGGRICAR